MKRIFLTGISGLLGINLANQLLEQGYYVKGLIREKSGYKGNPHKNLELIRGNLSDDLTPYCEGCEFIIHAAAETRQNLVHYSGYKEVNCLATIQLYQSGLKCGVKKFVYVSSANTVGHGSFENPGTEQNEALFPFTALFYVKSKLEAENYLLHTPGRMEVIIINPGFMIGAYDTKPSSGKIILMGLNKKIIFYPPGGKGFVHVRDVAHGIISGLQKGRNGERYLVINENMTYKEFYEKLNQVTDQHPVMVKIPKPVLLIFGYFGELFRLAGVRTDFSILNMRALCIGGYYSNEKSVSELGIEYHSLDSAISEAVEYFRMADKT